MGKLTSSYARKRSLFGSGATKVIFIAALRSRLPPAITATRDIPPTRKSTRFWTKRFSANMKNGDRSRRDAKTFRAPPYRSVAARAAIGHASAAPPSSVMNSRRFMSHPWLKIGSTLPIFLVGLTSRYCLPANTIVTGLAFLITWPVGASSPDVASTRNVTTVSPCSLAA